MRGSVVGTTLVFVLSSFACSNEATPPAAPGVPPASSAGVAGSPSSAGQGGSGGTAGGSAAPVVPAPTGGAGSHTGGSGGAGGVETRAPDDLTLAAAGLDGFRWEIAYGAPVGDWSS